MRHYAIQTNLTSAEIHEKLGFEPMENLMLDEFDDSKEQVYIMSCDRLNMRDIGDFSIDELMKELCLRDIRDSDFRKFSLKTESEED